MTAAPNPANWIETLHPVVRLNDEDLRITLLGVTADDLPSGYTYRQLGPRPEQGYTLVWQTRGDVDTALAIARRLYDKCMMLRVQL